MPRYNHTQVTHSGSQGPGSDMAGLLGKIDDFNSDLEEWPQYVERLGHFFEANGITGADNATKRCSTFLSVIGPGPYKLLRSLLTPDKPSDKTFEELTALLSKHYSSPPVRSHSTLPLQLSLSECWSINRGIRSRPSPLSRVL